MRARKSKEANLEPRRKSYLMMGVAVACALSLTAFEWTTPATISVLGEVDPWGGVTIEPAPPLVCKLKNDPPKPLKTGGLMILDEKYDNVDESDQQEEVYDDLGKTGILEISRTSLQRIWMGL